MTMDELEKQFNKIIKRTVDDKALLRMDLRDRMAVMAKLGQELIHNGIEGFFVAAVVTKSGVVFPANVIYDEEHKEEMRKHLVALAKRVNALCVIIVTQAWSVKETAENFQPNLHPSLHPDRQEVLVVNAKDYFEHLTGFQFIRRSEDRVDFDELQIGQSPRTWLDEWQVKVPTTTAC